MLGSVNSSHRFGVDYPRKQKQIRDRMIIREVTAFDRKEVVAQCKLEIDRKLLRQAKPQEANESSS
jgi:hypothetical protein